MHALGLRLLKKRVGGGSTLRYFSLLHPPEIAMLLEKAKAAQAAAENKMRKGPAAARPKKSDVPVHQRRQDSVEVLSVPEEEQRSQSIAVLGAPNAGKSTLLNRLLGSKISIVSPKAQTTRERVVGIFTKDATQTVFLDTPGVLPFGGTGIKKIPGELSRSSWIAAEEAEMVMVVVDAAEACRRLDTRVKFILSEMCERGLKGLLVLNKVDLVHPKEKLLKVAQKIFEEADFSECFYVSSTHGTGLSSLEDSLSAMAPLRPWQYPKGQVHTASKQDLALELLREKVYQRLNQELPYVLAQEISEWRERKDGSVHIKARLLVHTKHQAKMVVGHGGGVVKVMREQAVVDLEKLLQAKVWLKLEVVVSKGEPTLEAQEATEVLRSKLRAQEL